MTVGLQLNIISPQNQRKSIKKIDKDRKKPEERYRNSEREQARRKIGQEAGNSHPHPIFCV
jgi:hypothetical protein